jgi:SAM-dependent methyltransferase
VIDSAANRTAPHGSDAAIPAQADSARAHGRFEDAARWSRAWDDPERYGWQDPQRVVDLLRLRPGMRVADIGAGTGYFNPFLSRAVGPDGLVFAADIESTLVAHMQSRAAEESTANVRPVLAAPDDPRIPVARLDRVLLVNTYHHVDGRIGYFRRLRRQLDENSLVVIVDWLPGQLARGPAPVHKVTPEEAMEEMRAAGYRVVERADLRYQYVLVFRPQP